MSCVVGVVRFVCWRFVFWESRACLKNVLLTCGPIMIETQERSRGYVALAPFFLLLFESAGLCHTPAVVD